MGIIREDSSAQRMRRYLLGELPENTQIQLETEYFARDEVFDELLAVEDELMYDYLRGVLRPAERAAFERRFLGSPEAAVNRQFAESLIQAAGSAPAPAPAEPKLAWWRSPILQVAMAALLILLVSALWLVRETFRLSGEVSQLRQDRDNLRKQVQTQPLESKTPPIVASFILSPGLVRGSEQPARLRIPGEVGDVRFQLDLRKHAYQRYRAILRTAEGIDVWSGNVSFGAGQAVLTVPAAVIRPGAYEITLQGATDAGAFEDAADYHFTAVKR